MLLVLAHADDRLAARVAEAAASAGSAVVVVPASSLASASWSHRRDGGRTSTVVRVLGRPPIDLATATGVLNRITFLPARRFPRAIDTEYAAMERQALVVSALAALSCPVANRPVGSSLAGPVHTPMHWLATAAAAGIPVRRVRVTMDGRGVPPAGTERSDWEAVLSVGGPDDLPLHPAVPSGHRPVAHAEPVEVVGRVSVVGDRAMGAPDPVWADRCLALARAGGVMLAVVTLGRRVDGTTVVTGVDSLPHDLDPEAVDALVATLTTRVPVGGAHR